MKKWLFVLANLCYVYMLVLLCLLNPYKVNEDDSNKVNLQANTSEKTNYTPLPYKTTKPTATPIPVNVPSDWYITERYRSILDGFENILILGLDGRFDTMNLAIYSDVNMVPVSYNADLFKWSSSNPQVATVINGEVIAKSEGSATISVEKDGLIKKYEIKVFSDDNVDVVTEVDNVPVTNEITIDSQIYFTGHIFIKEINYKVEIPNFTRAAQWTSSDTNKIRVYNDDPYSVAVPFMAGKATLTCEIFGRTTKIDLNIKRPDVSKITSSKNNITFYTEVYDGKLSKSDTQYLQTAIEVPFQLKIINSKGKEVNIARFIEWKSSDINVSDYIIESSGYVGFCYNTIIAKQPGKVLYTGKYFGYSFSFIIDVSKGEASKPNLVDSNETSIYTPQIQDPIYPFEKDSPSPMSEINKKIIYLLKDNINDPGLINDDNKDSIRIETIKTGYFTQQKDKEIIAIMHLEKNDEAGKIYNEILGIFDYKTFKYKTHKIFTAKAPNSIYVDNTSVLFIPMDPEHDYMANTIEVWTLKDCVWKISCKPKDTQYHRYAIRKGRVMVFDKVDKIDCEWEYKYSLLWKSDRLTYYRSGIIDQNETRIEIEQASIVESPQNQNIKYTDNDIKLTGLNVICSNLIYNVDEFVNDIGGPNLYDALRMENTDKSKISSEVHLVSLEYGYFTQTEKLEILAIFEVGTYFDCRLILMVCNPETYEVIVQSNIYSSRNYLFNIYEDEYGRSRILYIEEYGHQGYTGQIIELYEANAHSIDKVWTTWQDSTFSHEDGFAVMDDKLIILKRVFIGNSPPVILPWLYSSEYKWDPLQKCFVYYNSGA